MKQRKRKTGKERKNCTSFHIPGIVSVRNEMNFLERFTLVGLIHDYVIFIFWKQT